VQHIFGRFYRSHDPRVQERPGTGLGLAITKSLVALHNGEIWVESEPGKGSAFSLTLPLSWTMNPTRRRGEHTGTHLVHNHVIPILEAPSHSV
jgi:signal transduction histidine kinase